MNKITKIKSIFSFVCCLLFGMTFNISFADQDTPSTSDKPSISYGQEVYMQRCVLCHGQSAEGDGRMAKVLKSPPPYDLTASRQSDDYLKEIIMKGSEALGRSKHMPPWGEALNEVEIDSVILYIKSIRD